MATIDLMSCDGGKMSRVTGARPAVRAAFLDGSAAELPETKHYACAAGGAAFRGLRASPPEAARLASL
jgi:hypothetical protein